MTDRIKNDAYQTPIETVESLLPFIDFRNHCSFLEPCRGEGNIYNSIPLKGSLKDYCEIDDQYEGVKYSSDYLGIKDRDDFDNVYSLIITNPPFSHWREFLELSLSHAETVVYLLRLNILGSGSRTNRRDFWNANKPTHLFPLQERPSFTGKGTDSTDYAWFCWDRGNRIKTNEWLTVL